MAIAGAVAISVTATGLQMAPATAASAGTDAPWASAIALSTDKAAYAPGQKVHLHISHARIGGQGRLAIKLLHLGQQIGKTAYVNTNQTGDAGFTFTPPAVDYRGYLVSVTHATQTAATKANVGTIGVDVSSDWGKFPRYGFLSDFYITDKTQMSLAITILNRYHINGIQFYDWQDSHNQPITLTDGQPPTQWEDINHRTTYFDTVLNYIKLAHSRGMKAMNYNLLYGAYQNAASEGVDPSWALYSDANATTQASWPLPGWESDLMLENPANPGWQNYITAQEATVQRVLPFDGWHVDQLGGWNVYDAQGNSVDLSSAYSSFLTAAKSKLGYDLVMNAVDGFAQHEIAHSNAVKFNYTEVWNGQQTLGDLKTLIDSNAIDSADLPGGSLNSVLAAYMDYDAASNIGKFNTPGVLLADAAIFAAGGDHLELGEHMLGKEYFPNANLIMTPDLQWWQLVRYYDFAVAYENVLRDGVSPTRLDITAGKVPVSTGSTSTAGTVWAFARNQAKDTVVHLINLRGLDNANWRDTDGMQKTPKSQTNLKLSIAVAKKIKSVYVASPDNGGLPLNLKFTQSKGRVSVTVPSLKYWDVLVLSY